MEQVAEAEKYMWGLGVYRIFDEYDPRPICRRHDCIESGTSKVILFASLIVMLGLTYVLPAIPWLSIVGFTFSGIGYALLVPVVFSEAGRQPGVSPSQGIAAVATVGYFGFLVGPVLIGGISE